MTEEELSTKDKILAAAGQLFAKNGLSGTSVREIATAANVNLAAINYHFDNKENLYWATFTRAFETLDRDINQIQSGIRTEELAWEIYRTLETKSHQIRHTFTMMISDMSSAEAVKSADLSHLKKGVPPGFERLTRSIAEEYGENIPFYGRFWATITIFNLLIHAVLVNHSSFFKEAMCSGDEFSQKLMDQNVKFQIRATLKFLQTNVREFESLGFEKNLAERFNL